MIPAPNQALAKARLRRQLRRGDLARRMAVSEALIGMIEAGQRRLLPEVAAAAIRTLRDEELLAACQAACPVCQAARICRFARQAREAA